MSERDLFIAALNISDQAERSAWLDRECGANAELRQRIDVLLQAFEKAGSLLDHPAVVGETVSQPSFHRTNDINIEPCSEAPGTVIGPYKLLQQIGEGGMGLVFMAEQTEPVRRLVALKLIKEGLDSRQIIARFEAERQALALMDHPNIAKVFDGGTVGQALQPDLSERKSGMIDRFPSQARKPDLRSGRPYFVMELVKGLPITKYCDEHHLTPRQRLELFVPVCQAVQHAHQKGIIHRDLKPSNVLVAQYDGKPVPKVIDFGVAKAAGPKLTDMTLFTELGAVVGTFEYMSPEQAELNQLDVDTRSDIYSLGVLLYELLTGTTPLERGRVKHEALLEVLRLIREEEPPRPSLRLSDLGRSSLPSLANPATVPALKVGRTSSLASISALRQTEPAKLTRSVRGELDWIVMKALEKDRNRRYETANGFAMDIQRYLADEAVQACPPSVTYRIRKFAQRNRAAFWTTGVVALALIVGTVVSAWQAVRATQQSVRATEAEGLAQERLETAKANYEEAEEQRQAAKTQEALANDQRKIAVANEKTAKEQELLARRRFYASQINLAQQAWENGNPMRVVDLLEGMRPKFDQRDLRTFEWYLLWQLCHNGHQMTLRGHQGQVNAVVPSPDGTLLASGGEDENLRLWDLRTGEERATLKQSSILSLAFSPDGKTLCAGSWSDWDRGLRIWDVATGREQEPLPGDTRDVWSLAFSPDGKMLVALGGGKVMLWDMAQRRLMHQFEAHPVNGQIALSPDGKTLVTITHWEDNLTKVWDLSISPPRLLYKLGGADAVAVSPDGRVLATGAGTSIKLWDLAGGRERAQLQGHRGTITALAFAPDGKTLASACMDRSLKVWDIASGKEINSQAHRAPILCVAYADRGNILVTGSLDGSVKMWHPSSNQEPVTLRYGDPVMRLHFSKDGETLLAGGYGPIKAWETSTGKERYQPPVPLAGGALSSDLKMLLVWSPDGSAKVLDRATGETRGVLSNDRRGPRCAAFAPDGKTLATGGPTAQLWEPATGLLRSTLPTISLGTTAQLAFSPDGKLLALGTQYNVARLWNLETGQYGLTIGEGGNGWIWALAFSVDGKILAMGYERGLVKLWEVSTGRLLVSLKGHTDKISSIAFAPDGLTVATASDDNTVRLWDVESGQERLSLKGHGAAVEFSPDGKTLATGGRDGTIKLWRAATGADAHGFKSELDADDPDSPAAMIKWGDALKRAARYSEAEANFRQVIPRLERLSSEFPMLPDYQQELARSHLALGFVLANAARPMEAERENALAIKLFEIVAGSFPNASDPRKGIAYDYGRRLFSQFIANGQFDAAKEAGRVAIELYGQLEIAPQIAVGNNNLAWLLATCIDLKFRDPKRAVELAKKAVELAPEDGMYWNTLGVAQYRAGDWKTALTALEKSNGLLKGNQLSFNAFFLAMAHWQLGNKEEARKWQEKAVQWMEKNASKNEDLIRFRAEAEKLLGVTEKK